LEWQREMGITVSVEAAREQKEGWKRLNMDGRSKPNLQSELDGDVTNVLISSASCKYESSLFSVEIVIGFFSIYKRSPY
jgi:hypothetical protein